MKKLLKISSFLVLLGVSMILFYYLCIGNDIINSIKNVVISQYESGVYSEEDIERSKVDYIVKGNIDTFVIKNKYIDIETSKDIDNIHVEYYSLPNVNIELRTGSENNFTANFIDSKYELVFNKDLDKYRRVKVRIPENMEFKFFLVIGQQVKIDGIHVKDMEVPLFYISDESLDISNIKADKLSIRNYKTDKLSIKDSVIDEFNIDSPEECTYTLSNVSGKRLNFGQNYPGIITGMTNYKVTLNNVNYLEQGYYDDVFDISINNEKSLSDYYFNLTTTGGKIKVNDKEYTSSYESTNKENSKYKVFVRSNNTKLNIK